MRHLTRAELEAALEAMPPSPGDGGVLELIVRRPRVGEREVVDEAQLDLDEGLVGDTWRARALARTPGAAPNTDTQINVMNARVARLIAGDTSRWPLAGDQLYVDLDIGAVNLPPGTRLAIGAAVIEVTAEPHTGCGKFVERFGVEAMKLVNSPHGRRLALRGINARVVRPGTIRRGDAVRKVAADA
jgi:hypothetical protein